MKIEFKNLGKIKKGTIDIGNLTIFCGSNNSGKTYAAYTIYGINTIGDKLFQLKRFPNNIEGILEINLGDLIENNPKNSSYRRILSKTFNSPVEYFKSTYIKVNYDTEKIIKNKLEINKSFSSIKDTRDNIEKEELLFSLTKKAGEEKAIISFSNSDSGKDFVFDGVAEYITNIYLRQLISNHLLNHSFILPSMREGINVFYNELNANRENLIYQKHLFDEKDIPPRNSRVFSKYPLPVSDYIKFINLVEEENGTSEYEDLANELISITGGSYQKTNGRFFFKTETGILQLHLASSVAKSLMGLYLYLKYSASKNDLLIIDEPEINLHPDNQRLLARFIAKMVNRGIKVIITTHSDYIVKEFNNLLMLSEKFNNKEHIMDKYGYKDSNVLSPEKVKAYLFDKSEISEMPIGKEGIILSTFDDVINNMNEISDEIYYSLEDEPLE